MKDTKRIVSLVPSSGPVHAHSDAKEVLEDALNQNYEIVIVFGFKDGAVYSRHSACLDALTIIGALTVARDDFWEKPR
jgi:hypothetical protein